MMKKIAEIVGASVIASGAVFALLFVVSAIQAAPLWLIWNGLAPTYGTGLPTAWKHLPFWDTYFLTLGIGFFGKVLFPTSITKIEQKK